MMRSLLLAVLLLPMAACNLTPVAIVDNYAGFEHVIGERSAHLETTRSAITRCEREADQKTYRFHLDAILTNEAKTTWIVKRKDWRITADALTEDTPTGITVCLAGGGSPDDTMVAVPPNATSSARLVVEIDLPSGSDIQDVERFRVMLRFGDSGNQLMEKQISIGVFDQGGQALRMFGVVTIALVLLSFA